MTVPSTHVQVQTISKSTPPPTTRKPSLKPKPKLNAYQQKKHKVVGGGGASSNSSEPSSLPILNSSPQAMACDSTDEGEDYYVDPVCFQRDDTINFSGDVLQQRKSPLLTQTNPMHLQRDSVNKALDAIHSKPLPDPPTHSQQDWGVVRGRECTQDSDEDTEPVYDEISEHTLLLRMPRPRLESSSSSD